MAVGKNKRLTKGSKKGGKKKVVDPFTKKDWYSIKAPAVFKSRNVGHTLVTRTIGNKIAADGLKGRVYDCNQADLNDDGQGHRKFKLVCEDVQGKNCILNFHGMSLTRDKMCGMVKKWQTMIQCAVDAKTTDNYHLRVFVVAFTKKQSQGQIKKTTYAQSQQVKQIRKKMTEIVSKQVSNCDVPELIKKLLPDSIASDITKAAMPIYPVENCYVSKIKVVKKPKLDLHRLAELHGEAGVKVNAKGERVDRGDHYEPPVAAEV
jgi:small subunit ribosomal protein S3Ae